MGKSGVLSQTCSETLPATGDHLLPPPPNPRQKYRAHALEEAVTADTKPSSKSASVSSPPNRAPRRKRAGGPPRRPAGALPSADARGHAHMHTCTHTRTRTWAQKHACTHANYTHTQPVEPARREHAARDRCGGAEARRAPNTAHSPGRRRLAGTSVMPAKATRPRAISVSFSATARANGVMPSASCTHSTRTRKQVRAHTHKLACARRTNSGAEGVYGGGGEGGWRGCSPPCSDPAP